MTMTDPIADMLTRIRNGIQARHPSVEMPSSTVKVAIAEVLRDEGYIKGFAVSGEGPKKTLKVDLKYAGKNEPIVTGIKRISKPGLRVYAGANEIPRVYRGHVASASAAKCSVTSGNASWYLIE